MPRSYLAFMDWMKVVGMFLIVFGHVVGGAVNFVTPPIYPKQLGVAFFMFVMAYSLAQEHRPKWRVVYSRLFEIWLFGILIALAISGVMYVTHGTLSLSNYLPFVLGVNVVLNHFPANPTTWYIGTYLHILVLWAFALKYLRLTPWLLALGLIVEVPVRAVVLSTAGTYVSYMLVSNWLTVFLLGMWIGQREVPLESEPRSRFPSKAGYLLVLVALAVTWYVLVTPRIEDRSFPFMSLSWSGARAGAMATSLCVSLLYLAYTWLIYRIVSGLIAPGWVRFLARNTLIVFIAHMPVYYALRPLVDGWPYALRGCTLVIICYAGLAGLSEIVRIVVRPKALRAALAPLIFRGVETRG